MNQHAQTIAQLESHIDEAHNAVFEASKIMSDKLLALEQAMIQVDINLQEHIEGMKLRAEFRRYDFVHKVHELVEMYPTRQIAHQPPPIPVPGIEERFTFPKVLRSEQLAEDIAQKVFANA